MNNFFLCILIWSWGFEILLNWLVRRLVQVSTQSCVVYPQFAYEHVLCTVNNIWLTLTVLTLSQSFCLLFKNKCWVNYILYTLDGLVQVKTRLVSLYWFRPGWTSVPYKNSAFIVNFTLFLRYFKQWILLKKLGELE